MNNSDKSNSSTKCNTPVDENKVKKYKSLDFLPLVNQKFF